MKADIQKPVKVKWLRKLEKSHQHLYALAKECHALLYNGIKQDLVKDLEEAIIEAESI